MRAFEKPADGAPSTCRAPRGISALSSAAALPAVALAALFLVAGCAGNGPANSGTADQTLLDHSGGSTDAPYRTDRHNAYN